MEEVNKDMEITERVRFAVSALSPPPFPLLSS
jgi:hypothetical protein